jgi:hypothetical protein
MSLLFTLWLFDTVLTGGKWPLVADGGPSPAVLLREEIKPEEWRGYVITTTVEGELRGEGERKSAPVRVRGNGKHELAERILATSGGLPNHILRSYKQASVEVHVAGERQVKTLRPQRSCILYGRLPDGSRGFCPQGPLTRDELEIVTEHLAPSMLAGLLPGKVVTVGQSWKVGDAILGEVCLLDAVVESQVEGKLLSIEEGFAEFTIQGKVRGIDKGAQVTLQVEGKGRYDRRSGRIVECRWVQEDERTAGWWNPASRLRIQVHVQHQKLEVPESECSRAAVLNPQMWQQPKAELLRLEVEGPKKSYRLTYGREWYILGETTDHLILRLVDQGVPIAQLTLTHWRRAFGNRTGQIAEFRKAVAATPGWKPDKLLHEGEVDTGGRSAYRIIQEGKIGDQKIIQRFWLITTPHGEQLVMTVTLPPEHQQRFGDKDVELIRNLTFFPSP